MILRSTRTTGILFWLFSSVLLKWAESLDEAEANGCSFHQYYSCHEFATCIENPSQELEWTCVCNDNYEGDGLKGENNTGCIVSENPCRYTAECHTLAVCNENARCRCKTGYMGDGWLECLDINECLDDPCHTHASCENTDGSFECTCKMQHGYVGDGFHCQHECTMNYDCKEKERCVNAVCVCDVGYEEVNGNCYDIDECENSPCHQNADCINTEGSYICSCKNGYTGDGLECEAMPRTCHDIKLANPEAKNGEYSIDADGDGPLETMQVECEMRPAFGITILLNGRSRPKRVTNTDPTYDVTYAQSVDEIKEVIGQSNYCYQSMRYDGYFGARLMDGDDWWINGNGVKEENWGGSTAFGKCACGQLGYCTDRNAPCYNNGTEERQIDSGNVMAKNKLPILSVVSKPGPGLAKAWITIGPVMCAPVTFDIPLTCHDAKNLYKVKKDGPMQIDVDGPAGSLEPFLVHCDMESHKHVGITIIPVSNTNPTDVDTPGYYPIDYMVDAAALQKLVDVSEYCYQEAGYTCKNSRLLNNGNKQGWFSDIAGNEKDYWPGGLGLKDNCGCAITGTCQSDDYGCNCDVTDGQVRTDYGKVVAKEDLPIGSMTFLDVGSGKTGSYYVGPLQCSQEEFGFGPTCQEYAYMGYTESQTFLIDPDGPPDSRYPDKENQPPFPVYCDITASPPSAATIVYHDQEEYVVDEEGVYSYIYKEASLPQLVALTTRAVTCVQTLTYVCNSAPINVNQDSVVTWQTPDGRSLTYFAGNGSEINTCACGLDGSCTGNMKCNCDVVGTSEDTGLLINKLDLPVMSTTFSDLNNGAATVYLGPLECKELYPTCAEMRIKNVLDDSHYEYKPEDGFYTIDPDGAGSVEPFLVECLNTKTIVSIEIGPGPTENEDPDKPVSFCYDITYKTNGIPVTPVQVQALVDSSKFCAQQLSQDCLNAPLINHSNFTTCDWQPQTGWAGSRGKEGCACGVNGHCEGGPDTLCNCEVEDGTMRQDGSWILDEDRLAICEVCVSLDPVSTLTTSPKARRVLPFVSDLFCDEGSLGKGKSCHDWRNQGMDEPGTQMLDPDDDGPAKAAPVYCMLQVYPPLTWTEILPKAPEHEVPPEGITITVEYYVYSMEFIIDLIKNSGYCTQELWLDCVDASLDLSGAYGWYSVNGEVQSFWAGNEEGTTGCAGGTCQCNLAGERRDGGLIIDGTLLPVSSVVLGPSSGERKLTIGPVKCFDLPKSCNDIKSADRVNLLGNHTYVIDPDGAGGVEPFAVTCDFKTDNRYGITEVPVVEPRKRDDRIVVGHVQPGSHSVPVIYHSATYEQINALAKIQPFCFQDMMYECYHSPIHPGITFYNTYGSKKSVSFGIAGNSSMEGCGCLLTRTCPELHKCHCDKLGPQTIDYGFEINNEVLPVQEFNFGGQINPQANALFDISSVRCSLRSFGLPKTCDEAFKKYKKKYKQSGEILILPHRRMKPFVVYCDMNILEKGGVTIIGNNFEEGVPVTFGTTMSVTYHNADKKQIQQLVRESKFCYQPFKYQCQNTKFLGEKKFFWKGGNFRMERYYVGYGLMEAEQCNCGRENSCGGSEDKETLQNMTRKCNCDAADDQERADAGVFNDTLRLPLQQLNFLEPGRLGASGIVTLGKLYCSNEDFDLDECKLGFHDCHKEAKCINRHGFFECQCQRGWKGLGRTDVLANGRNCYDDDECAMNLCPWSADCVNTPGSYKCICKEGFNQTTDYTCKDLDECELGTHNCSENARCFNLVGSFDCKCNRNYRGDGFECEPLGMCACFGDPHCLTMDGKMVDYQGECQYTMSRDACDGQGNPSFEVLTTFSRRDNIAVTVDASWVKEVTVNVYNYSVLFLQGGDVWVNGYSVNLPYRRSNIKIFLFGKYIEMYTELGLEVRWDGDEAIEVYTPGHLYKGQLCGLCGNYNDDPSDDLTIGPACPDSGSQTTNLNLFGNSWVVPSYVAENPTCEADCNPENDTGLCEGVELELAKQTCMEVWDPNGRFKDCLMIIDEFVIESYLYGCTYDLCRIEGDPEAAICKSAEKLVKICMSDYDVEILSFRTEDFCGISCSENMEYDVCGQPNQMTCMDVLAGSGPDFQITLCEEGCFCKEGYVLEGDQCVYPAECGCLYEDNYYKVGDEVVLSNCGEVAECGEDHQMVTKVIDCHPGAECKLKKGRYGCHCRDGYYGNGVDECILDPCLNNPCGVNETCIRKPRDSQGYECLCNMGFSGDCGNCVEVDECLTATHNCPTFSRCINTIGSFRCECYEGFTLFGGQCNDDNECEIKKPDGTARCRNNSQCVNRIGKYECPCCSGFEEDDNGNCVESATAGEGPVCCTCDIAICNEPGRVCGEDGVNYDSVADMIISNCEKGLPPSRQINVDYFKPCASKCSADLCPKYQTCVIDSTTNKPTCLCEDCTEDDRTTGPVCTDRLDLYETRCLFKKIQCFLDHQAVLLLDTKPCDEKNGGKPVGPWGGWSSCSVTCGKGLMTRTRATYKDLSESQAERFPLEQTNDCYSGGPCPDSACVSYNCEHKAEECVDVDGVAVCECPDCENIGVEPVCGFIANKYGRARPGTWQSACHLQRQACEEEVFDFEIMYDGHCGVEPKNCTRMPNSQYIRGGDNDKYVSSQVVNLYTCEGSCGFIRDDCCQPVEFRTVQVTMKDKNDNTMLKNVEVVDKCECIDVEEVGGQE